MSIMEQSDLDLLQTLPPHHLQVVIKARGISAAPKTQNTVTSPDSAANPSSASLTDVARALFAEDALRDVLATLSELEMSIMRELVLCGGRANSRDLAFYFSSAGLLSLPRQSADNETSKQTPASPRAYITAPQYPIANPHGTFELALRQLLLLGLLFWGRQTNFAGRDYTSGTHDGVLIVPHAVQDVALMLWKSEEDARTLAETYDVGDGARTLQRSLYLYWSMINAAREGLSLLGNGLLSRPALRHVLDHMFGKNHKEPVRQENDFPRLLFLRLLLLKLGLLQVRKNVLHAVNAEEFFSLSLAERVRRCYHLYVESPFWNEILYLAEVNVRPGPTPLEAAHEENMRARQMVIERLLHESVDVWCSFSAFIAHCKLHVPYLLFPRQYGSRAERYSSNSNPYGWDFRLRRGWLTHREGWHMVEGGFIRAVVGGPLYWLGLVSLDQEQNPTSFNLSPAFATIASSTSIEREEVPWGRLIVQPNFELVVLAPVSEALLIKLDRFADRVSLEHIAQYRLTKTSVSRAIQMGLHTEQIQAILTQAAGSEIPQNVSYSLSEWERQARRVEVWPGATLLEVDDESMLDTLLALPEMRNLFKRRLSPRLIEVNSQQLPIVQEILWRHYHLPALSSAPTLGGVLDAGRLVVREAQWHLHKDGLLQPLYAVCDLYLVSELAHFSEHDENASWQRVTEHSIQDAMLKGIQLDYIIRFLQQYCEGGIPGSLLIRLKLWGGSYGPSPDAHVERAPLLRLPSQILQDLRNDEELQHLLGSDVPPDSRLVHVDENALPRILELLRERGFNVE
jgi:Helicase conserved C-terminal domain